MLCTKDMQQTLKFPDLADPQNDQLSDKYALSVHHLLSKV